VSEYFIGIDPGLSGGMACVNRQGVLLEMSPLPLLSAAREDARDTINAKELLFRLQRVDPTRTRVLIERIGARPGQSVQSSLTAGRNYGMIEAALQIASAPYEYVTPQNWQKALGVPQLAKGATQTERKKASRATAERLFNDPRIEKLRAKDDGLWEAALIALANLRMWVRS
jgi:crossover junction endodeoxyribonuclease RuvC